MSSLGESQPYMVTRHAFRRHIGIFLALMALTADAALASSQPSFGDSRVLASVPDPGNPEEIAVRGNLVYVGTTVGADGAAIGDGQPSKIFAFDTRTGALVREFTVEGENVNALHGITGLAFDRDGHLYAASVSHGIIRLNTTSAEQSLYAQLPDLKPCAIAGPPECSPTPEDRAPLGNGITFDRSGALYVADSFQATIFRIPPGGGEAEVWYSDARLHGFFGANGIKMSPDGRHVYVSVTGDLSNEGHLYRLPHVARPTQDDLELVRSFGSDQPDGIAFGRSGLLYVVMGSGSLVILNDDGTVAHEVASEHFYNPSSVGFDGRGNALITNHAFTDLDPGHQTIVQVVVNDAAHPLARPNLD